VKLSSGSRIIDGSDDAGGLAVASRLKATSKRAGVVAQNIGNAISFLQVQDGALKSIGGILERMDTLQALYQDKTKSQNDINLYKIEFMELSSAVKNIISNTSFNSKSVFDSLAVTINPDELESFNCASPATSLASLSANQTVTSITSGGSASKLVVSTSATSATSYTTTIIEGYSQTYDGVSDNSLADISNPVRTVDLGPILASNIKDDIQTVAQLRAQNGANQNILDIYSNHNSSLKINYDATIGHIMDLDIAEESTKLAKFNTLVQAGLAMSAQSNSISSNVLSLLKQ
jgi:flagellin